MCVSFINTTVLFLPRYAPFSLEPRQESSSPGSDSALPSAPLLETLSSPWLPSIPAYRSRDAPYPKKAESSQFILSCAIYGRICRAWLPFQAAPRAADTNARQTPNPEKSTPLSSLESSPASSSPPQNSTRTCVSPDAPTKTWQEYLSGPCNTQDFHSSCARHREDQSVGSSQERLEESDF